MISEAGSSQEEASVILASVASEDDIIIGRHVEDEDKNDDKNEVRFHQLNLENIVRVKQKDMYL